MSAPKCPKELELKRLIKVFNGEEAMTEQDVTDALNAMVYLDVMLSNRKGYQRKQQIKRKLLWKAADEMGLMKEIDDAARAKLGEEFEALDEGAEGEADEADDAEAK